MSDRPTYYIVGANNPANRELSRRLNQHTPVHCAFASRFGPVAPSRQSLWLLDLDTLPEPTLYRLLQTALSGGVLAVLLAFANVTDVSTLDQLLIYPQLRGIFHAGTTPEAIARGINAIWDGELWLPRRFFSDCLKAAHHAAAPLSPRLSVLTNKEREILSHIAQGNTNTAIAESLHLSVHTVKTHIYNLFRKLGVENRTQATNWANANHILLTPPASSGCTHQAKKR